MPKPTGLKLAYLQVCLLHRSHHSFTSRLLPGLVLQLFKPSSGFSEASPI